MTCNPFIVNQCTLHAADPRASDKNSHHKKHLVLVSIRMYTSKYEKGAVSSVSMDAANWPWLPIRGCGFSFSMVEQSLGLGEGPGGSLSDVCG